MYINGVPISRYGAKLLADYTVGSTPLTTDYYKPRSGSGYVFLGVQQGLRPIALNFDLYGKDFNDCSLKKSAMDALASSGKVELYLPDGFLYTSILQSAGDQINVMPGVISFSYSFLGIRHEKEQKVITSGFILARGTMPKMDCCLTAVVSADTEVYQLGEAMFYSVLARDILTFDGIDKRILINGAPGAQKCEWIHFPYLVPGENIIICQDPVTVRYAPAYI